MNTLPRFPTLATLSGAAALFALLAVAPVRAADLPDFSSLVTASGPAVVNISSEQKPATAQAARPKLPSSSATSGCHDSSCFARVMSGQRRTGSSGGSGWCSMGERLRVSRSTRRAMSSTVCSSGLPRLTGPVTPSGASISRTRPSIRSST